MTAASARQGLASTSQAGPAGAVTDHSDCSGTAGIASYRLSIIDYRAKGGRLYGRRRGRSNQRASARPTGCAFSGPCRCARLQRKASAAKAPHGRAIRRATARHGAKPNDAYSALHGVPDAISASQVRSYAVPDVERAGARGTATTARRASERTTAAAEEPALGVRLR